MTAPASALPPHASGQQVDRPIAAGAGFVALDLIATRTGEYVLAAGGSVGNVQILLAARGWSAYPIALLANDPPAALVLADLARWEVHCDWIDCSPAGRTPIVVQRRGTSAASRLQPRYATECPRCGRPFPNFVPISLAGARRIAARWQPPRIFHFDLLSRSALWLARQAALDGGLVVFEPYHAGYPRLFREAIELAHVVKYSRARRRRLPGTLQGKQTLLEIETLGSKGVRYRGRLPAAGDRWRQLPAFPVGELADSAGAGDWFTAGWLDRVGRLGMAGLRSLTSRELQTAMEHGQQWAAWNCQFSGARGGMQAPGWQRRLHRDGIGDSTQPEAATAGVAKRSPVQICRHCQLVI